MTTRSIFDSLSSSRPAGSPNTLTCDTGRGMHAGQRGAAPARRRAGPVATSCFSASFMRRVAHSFATMAILALAVTCLQGSGVAQTRPCTTNLNANLNTLGTTWPEGLIYYAFDAWVSQANQQLMLAQMEHLERTAGLHFVPDFGQPNVVWIHNSFGLDNYSTSIGMQGGLQHLYITDWNSPGMLLHQLLHVAGEIHTNQQQNSLSYIDINWANILPLEFSNFRLIGASTVTTYDFESIMHASEHASSNGAGPSITVRSPNQAWQQRIGQLVHLSQGDIATLRATYGYGYFAQMEAWSGYNIGTNNDFRIGDFNGDGRSDVLRYVTSSGGSTQVLISTGQSLMPAQNWSTLGLGTNGKQYVGDFNGDGRTDLAIYTAGVGLQVALSNGSAFAAPQVWTPAGLGTLQDFWVGDFNGDGFDDILRFIPPPASGPTATTGMQISYGNASGTAFTHGGQWGLQPPMANNRYYIGDFNGDGKDDVMTFDSTRGILVCLSTGSSFVSAAAWGTASPGTNGKYYVGDFDGDGIVDLMRIRGSFQEVMPSRGNRFGNPTRWGNAGAGTISDLWVGDYDGDGALDLLRFLNLSPSSRIQVSLNQYTWSRSGLPALPTSGTACTGIGNVAPSLRVLGIPSLGMTLSASVSGVTSTPWMLVFGRSNRTYGGLTLPLSLTGLGAPGCNLYVSLDNIWGPYSSGGTATMAIPQSPGLVGANLYLQAIVGPAPSLNQLGLLTTEYVHVQIQ